MHASYTRGATRSHFQRRDGDPCDTPKNKSHIGWVDYKGTHRCAKSHIGSLLGENAFYK